MTRKVAGQTVLASETYTYNNANEMVSKVVDGVTTTYAYDGAGQLTAENRPGFTSSYTYDGNGNRLTKVLNGVTESYTYDDGDKMLTAGAKSYQYDAAGRTTRVIAPNGITNIAYDWESRISTINGPGITASYTYNGLDTRVSKLENGQSQTFVRDGAYVTDPVLRDTSAAYTPGISERRNGVSTWNHSGLKNQEVQTNSSNNVSSKRTYDAFGNVVSSTGTWNGPFGYAGGFGYQEDASGLKLLGHRYYDSSTGRFLTRDPIKDGRNWFVYCEGNSTTFIDQNGQQRLDLATSLSSEQQYPQVFNPGNLSGGFRPGGGTTFFPSLFKPFDPDPFGLRRPLNPEDPFGLRRPFPEFPFPKFPKPGDPGWSLEPKDDKMRFKWTFLKSSQFKFDATADIKNSKGPGAFGLPGYEIATWGIQVTYRF